MGLVPLLTEWMEQQEKGAKVVTREVGLRSRAVFTGASACLAAGILIAGAITFAHASVHPDYRSIDKHALSAPASATTSTNALAAWLTQPFRTDEDKARVIYRWITENISYDSDAFFSGETGSGSAEEALRNRRGVCEGYAGLFLGLAKAAGIKAIKISGFAKGYGYPSGHAVGSIPNHAWNAVSIDGKWRLLDCTWGSGYIGDDRRFHREFNPHYFFTAPEEFIFDHLPEKKEWQFLDRPRTKEEFERTIYLKPKFFALGLELRGKTEGTIHADGEVVIELGMSGRVAGTAVFMKNEKEMDGRQTFVQREGDAMVLRATPPGPGEYSLRLFAKKAGDPGQYDWVLEYRIESTARPTPVPAYPRTFKTFDDSQSNVKEPFSGILHPASSQRFALRVPGAEKVAVISGEEWTVIPQRGGLFEGDVKIASGVITVCAQFPGHESWDTLLEYGAK